MTARDQANVAAMAIASTRKTPRDTPPRLLDPILAARLERVRLTGRQRHPGASPGLNPSRRHGDSPEFADHRAYTPGDDPRRIDWNLYARMRRLFVTLHEQDLERDVHLVIDASRSMLWPESHPDAAKFLMARRLAAAFAFIALHSLDRVNTSFLAGRDAQDLGFRRGRSRLPEILDFLGNPPVPDQGGGLDFDASLTRLIERHRRSGLLILMTDLLDLDTWHSGLRRIIHAGFDLQVIRILHPGEVTPDLDGPTILTDVETGIRMPVGESRRALRAYHESLGAQRVEARRLCREHGAGLLEARSDEPLDDIVLRRLRGRLPRA